MEKYEKPDMEIVEFGGKDVITTSCAQYDDLGCSYDCPAESF